MLVHFVINTCSALQLRSPEIFQIAQAGTGFCSARWLPRGQLKQFPAYLNRWDSRQARNEGVFGH